MFDYKRCKRLNKLVACSVQHRITKRTRVRRNESQIVVMQSGS
jgi:hypothetical protein